MHQLRYLAFLLCLSVASVASACPSCKESIEQQDPAAAGLAEGFAYSIMLMLGTPPLILLSLGTMFYVQVQRSRRDADSSANDGSRPDVA